MPVVQISRIQHRRGKKTDLPQLAAGELGWSIDEQKLYIGNGTVADGAPAVGNTEIMTAGSSAFTTSLSHTYKGYLGDSTPIVTGATGNVSRTLQQRLDDYVSVKEFGATGDGSTADVVAIQRALDELYSDTDQNDARARRILFFPAGNYLISASLTIPPYAHLVGEGADKTIITNSASAPAMVTEDDDGQTYGNIGDSSATAPTQIQISNMTVKTTTNYGGLSIDNATHVYINDCKFQGTYTSKVDAATSKGITVRSTTALPCSNIVFGQCQFTGFARLIDMSYDVTNVRFTNCDFNTAYYGALLGAEMDGSTNGLTKGPRDVQFSGSSWSTIEQQAIYVQNSAMDSALTGVGPRNIISYGNWYADTVANGLDGVNSIIEVPVIQFDADECTSTLDFFERTSQRDTDFGDSTDPSNTPPEVQGIGLHKKAVKQITLSDNTSTATDTGIYLPGFTDKGVRITYKMNRGAKYRTGVFTISSAGELCTFNDDFEETSDVGTTLSAITSDGDSTAGNDTIRVKYVTTSDSSTAVTMEYQIEILV
tara:strand:+ start:4739 stop:6361 length:1623 start_codon:yes stop_codon:yes gene_type:complete